MLERMWKKGNLLALLVRIYIDTALWKAVWSLTKLGIKLPYDPAISPLGIYPEKTKIEKDTCTPIFTAALFTIERTQKQPRCPSMNGWIKKKNG